MPDERVQEQLTDYAATSARELSRARARQPKQAADVMADVMLRRGYGRMLTAETLRHAWRESVGQPLADSTAAVALRRGRLEVVADSSATIQELTFLRETILNRLASLLPGDSIRDLKIRVGPLS